MNSNDSMKCDSLLNGRVRLQQEDSAFRATSDSVFLAAASPIAKKVLDVGAGNGAVALCYGALHAQTRIDALELQQTAYNLLLQNISLNHMEERCFGVLGDIFQCDLTAESYELVMTNPPYLTEEHLATQSDERALSMCENGWVLADWLQNCFKFLMRKGWLVMIHRSDRLHDILAAVRDKVDRLYIYPLFSKEGEAAIRVLIYCRKKSSRSRGVIVPQLLQGMVLHKADGSYTDYAESILRGEIKNSIIDANRV